LITENSRSFIRHYLLDFGSALGSAAVGPREGWEGYEALVEQPGEIGKRVLSFGFKVPVWRTQDYFESPAIGRLPRLASISKERSPLAAPIRENALRLR